MTGEKPTTVPEIRRAEAAKLREALRASITVTGTPAGIEAVNRAIAVVVALAADVNTPDIERKVWGDTSESIHAAVASLRGFTVKP
jgi:hypothetical protein